MSYKSYTSSRAWECGMPCMAAKHDDGCTEKGANWHFPTKSGSPVEEVVGEHERDFPAWSEKAPAGAVISLLCLFERSSCGDRGR